MDVPPESRQGEARDKLAARAAVAASDALAKFVARATDAQIGFLQGNGAILPSLEAPPRPAGHIGAPELYLQGFTSAEVAILSRAKCIA